MTNNRQTGRAQSLLLGVCSTLSDKSGLPVTLVRVLAVVILFRLGFVAMMLTYLAAAILLPR
ncbi:MAG: PspC domain-containing protein [Proteobacteria bacterium]|jgi:phage shock protein PspC (stress-responsive transcriptional regulator)|nr:PspC domain-containing protein [Pseudomonadota bacterium]NMA23224.1 PspC domain-containing protein [Spirochaetales bacterium]